MIKVYTLRKCAGTHNNSQNNVNGITQIMYTVIHLIKWKLNERNINTGKYTS